MKQISLTNGQISTLRTANKEDDSNLISYINKIGGESDFLTFGKNEFDMDVKTEEEIIV